MADCFCKCNKVEYRWSSGKHRDIPLNFQNPWLRYNQMRNVFQEYIKSNITEPIITLFNYFWFENETSVENLGHV